MNSQKQKQIERIEQAMRQTFFTMPDRVGFDIDAWTEKVMADIRRQTFDESANLKVIGKAAWFALAASVLFAFLVYLSGDSEKVNYSTNEFFTGEQTTIESAYRN